MKFNNSEGIRQVRGFRHVYSPNCLEVSALLRGILYTAEADLKRAIIAAEDNAKICREEAFRAGFEEGLASVAASFTSANNFQATVVSNAIELFSELAATLTVEYLDHRLPLENEVFKTRLLELVREISRFDSQLFVAESDQKDVLELLSDSQRLLNNPNTSQICRSGEMINSGSESDELCSDISTTPLANAGRAFIKVKVAADDSLAAGQALLIFPGGIFKIRGREQLENLWELISKSAIVADTVIVLAKHRSEEVL